MAIKFYSSIDLRTNQLKHALLHTDSSAPTSPTPAQGQIYYNSGNDTVYTYDGSSWNAMASSSAMTAFILEDDDGTEVSVSQAEEIKFIGSGITTNWTDTSDGSDSDPFDMTFTVDAAQTGITSIYATDLIMGEDSETAIDFGTANEIDFKINNTTELTLDASALYPTGDAGLDLGTSSLEFKDAFFDGTVTSDAFAGPLTGNVTGDVSGSAATVTTAAQTAITSLGDLTALTVDDVVIDGKVITMTGSASDTAVFTAGTNGTLSIVTTDAAAAAANIQITADGTVDIDSAGVLTLDSGAAINIEPAGGSAILLDGTISIDAGVVTGATSITSTAFVGNITGNVTGNTSGTAATVTTAAQTNITSLGDLTALVVDDVGIDGKVITMTGSTGDTFVTTVATNGVTTLTTTDAGGAAANMTLTADGAFEAVGTTITLDSGGAINLEPAGGSAILLDGTISVDAGVVTGATSITSTAFVGDITGDVTGTADDATDAQNAANITVADESSDATCFPVFVTAASGNLPAKSGTNLTFNSSSGLLTATLFAGDITGDITGNADTATALATAREIGGTSFDGTGNITPANATLAAKCVVTNSTANTNFPVVFNDENSALLDDTGALYFNPSTGLLTVPNLSVAGTTTQVNTVTMNAQNAVVFEGATADAYETTLTIVDPLADQTIYLPDAGGYIPLIADASTTDGAVTAAEFAILDGGTSATSTTVADADRVMYNDNGTMMQVAVTDLAAYFDDEITAMPNLVSTGALASGTIASGFGSIVATTIDATTDFTIGSTVITDDSIVMTPSASDTATISAAANGILSIVTSEATGTLGDINITADGQIEYRANDAAGHIFDINGTNQVTIIDGAIIPTTNNDIDLGSDAKEFKDIWIDGTAYLDSATITAGTITGITDLVVADGGTGVSTFGSDAVLIGNGTSAITSSTNLTFDDTDLSLAAAGKMEFRDTAIYIQSSTDGQLDLVADTEIQIAATTIDVNGALDLSGASTLTGIVTTGGAIELGHATDNTLTASSGVLSIQGNRIFHAGGTDVPVADGGTGASSASAARTALGLEYADASDSQTGTEAAKVLVPSILAAKSVVSTIDVSDGDFTSNLYAEIPHSLGTEDVLVELFDATTKDTVYADVLRTDKGGTASTSKVKIVFAKAPTVDVEVVITSIKGATAATAVYA